MKPAILKLWVAALRSGKYKQARKYLRTSRGYCCLGVLCELYIQETGKGNWGSSAGSLCYHFVEESPDKYHRESSVLPDTVLKWAGLQTSSVELQPQRQKSDSLEATQLNDGSKDDHIKPHNFKQIADALLQATKAKTLR